MGKIIRGLVRLILLGGSIFGSGCEMEITDIMEQEVDQIQNVRNLIGAGPDDVYGVLPSTSGVPVDVRVLSPNGDQKRVIYFKGRDGIYQKRTIEILKDKDIWVIPPSEKQEDYKEMKFDKGLLLVRNDYLK